MKRQFTLAIASFIMLTSCAQEKKDHLVTIHTSMGDMKAILYDETPLHKENFLKLAKEGKYDKTIFHRIINQFMIQGGGIDQKNGTTSTETIPAEIVPKFYHEKGALAAARQGDRINPKKASSWCQFYIVHGKKYSPNELSQFQAGMNQTKKNALFSEVIQREKNKDLLATAQKFQQEKK